MQFCSARSAAPSGTRCPWISVPKPACSRFARNSASTSIFVRSGCVAALRGISPLRRERIADCDFEIIRELSGDIYFGAHEIHGTGAKAYARDVAEYSVAEIERVTRWAFERAESRNRRLASVDKANVLATSRLWRDTVSRIAAEYPARRRRASLRRQRRHAAAAQAFAIRRNSHRQSLRRYSQRRSRRSRRLHRLDSFYEPRPRRFSRALRTDSRLGSNARRKRHRLSARRDFLRGA